MTFNPSGTAAQNGFPGNLDAVDHAVQMNQPLGTPSMAVVYQGSQIVTPNGSQFSWTTSAATYDYDQAFTMSGTKIGRVVVPVLANGAGADLLVSLCPDSAGSPNTNAPLAQTLVPASWLTNLTSPYGLSESGPLVTVDDGTLLYTSTSTGVWTSPAGSPNGAPVSSSIVTNGNYFILIGGDDQTTGAATAGVTSTQWLGGGQLASPVPQPPLPLGVFRPACAITDTSIVVAGGQTASTSGLVSNVWSASWDPNTGTIGAWTAQASLPVALGHSGAASWPISDTADMVYVIGGSTDGFASGAVNTVYHNTIENGQLGSTWAKGPSLPQAEHFVISAAIGGWLIVTGGALTDTSITGSTYCAKIASDGTLSGWYTGPSLPTPVWTGVGSNWLFSTSPDALVVVGGPTDSAGSTFSTDIQVLPVTSSDGPGSWFLTHDATMTTAYRVSLFTQDSGTYGMTRILSDGTFVAYDFTPVPLVSVPLPASGLTNGATYHVVLHQRPTTTPLTDYLQFGAGVSGLPSDFKFRAVGSRGAWSTDASRSILVSVYDQTAGGSPLHTWQDPGSSNLATKASTFVSDGAGRLLGYLESVLFPNDPLNSNPTFITGTSPWTATNCTLSQSSAQTHGGFSESGLITPNGTSTKVYARSELIRVTPGSWYQAQGWLYSPTGWSNVSLGVNWYDASQTYITTSSNSVALSAATWTQQINNFQAPMGAAWAALTPTESTTPSAAALLYLSNITLTNAEPTAAASVAQLDYGSVPGAPTGVTQLN